MASARRPGTNENISTYGGGGRDYTALATWEAATDNDLVTATTSEVLECYADSASFNDNVDMAGAITSTLYFRIIRAASGEEHDGTPNSGIIFANTASANTVRINEDNSAVEDLVITPSVNSASTFNGISLIKSNSRAVGCIVANGVNAGSGASRGFTLSSPSGAAYVIDCMAINNDAIGFRFNDLSVAYNCTSVNNGTNGFEDPGTGTTTIKNCLADGNTSADYSMTATIIGEGNASGDATAVGNGVVTSMTFTFIDAGNDDYHLASTDTGAFQRGLNLSADATFAFDDDIDNDTILVWSIGADAQASFISSRRRAVGENVSTYGGMARDYTDLGTWESATDNDLVTSKVSEVLECYADAASFADTISMSAATTNASYHRIVRAATGEKHSGVPGAGVKFTATTELPYIINDDYGSFQDLEFTCTWSGAADRGVVSIGGDNCLIVGCIVKDSSNNGAGICSGFRPENTSGTILVNCLSVRNDDSGFIFDNAGNTVYFYNCTSIGSNIGNEQEAGTLTIKNCLSQGATVADFSGTFDGASTNNASGDGTASGTNARTTQSFNVVDAGNDDYHLTLADTGALGFGANLSADAVFPFNDDIDGVQITTWSIGFDSDTAVMSGDELSSESYPWQIQGMVIGFKRSWA